MALNEIDEYEVILRNGEEKYIVADNFEQKEENLFFFKEHIVVAWFNPDEIVGYRKVKEYFLDDSETIDETAGYGEEKEHE